MNAPSTLELKALVEAIGQTFEEYKRTNDALITAKADGKAIGDIEAKLAKMDTAMDAARDTLDKCNAAIMRLQDPTRTAPLSEKQEAFEVERKQFNMALRVDAVTKGRALPAEVDAVGYAAYKSAFFALARTGNIEQLAEGERKALSAGSDPDGGYMLPASTIGRVVAKVYEQSIMRQLADVQTIGTDAIEGLIDNDEAAAGWVSETGTRSESATPIVGKWRLEAHEMFAAPRATQKLLDDAAMDLEGWLAAKVADKFARVEGTAFWNGTGTGQPRGLATYTTAATADSSRAWGTFEHVVTGTNGAFNATSKGDVIYDLIGAFKDQYLQSATFVMRREVRTAIRKLKEATTDRYLWEPSLQAGVPDRLNGYPVQIDQYMPALATNSLSLALGDFRQAYSIVDRMGVRTLRDPYTAKPYVIFYSTRRVGGGAVNFEAVKFLKFST